MTKIRITATIVYENEMPDSDFAEAGYEDATTLDEAIALEKEWLAEDGDYLFQGLTATPSTVTIQIDKIGT
jgi:hypothetical protein